MSSTCLEPVSVSLDIPKIGHTVCNYCWPLDVRGMKAYCGKTLMGETYAVCLDCVECLMAEKEPCQGCGR